MVGLQYSPYKVMFQIHVGDWSPTLRCHPPYCWAFPIKRSLEVVLYCTCFLCQLMSLCFTITTDLFSRLHHSHPYFILPHSPAVPVPGIRAEPWQGSQGWMKPCSTVLRINTTSSPYCGSSLFQSSNSLQAIAMSSILQIQISKLFPKDYHYLHFTLNKNIWEGDILEDENGRRNITSLFIIHSFSVGLATWKLLEANWGKKSNLMFLVNRQFPAYSSAADRKLLTDFSELVLIYISEFNCYMQKLKWWSVIKFL